MRMSVGKHTIESPSYKHQQHCNPIRWTHCLQNTAWTREHTPVLGPALHTCLLDPAKRPTHGVIMTPSGHMANGMPRAAGRSMKQQATFSHVSVAMPDVKYRDPRKTASSPPLRDIQSHSQLFQEHTLQGWRDDPAEDPDSIPKTHMVAHNSLKLQS